MVIKIEDPPLNFMFQGLRKFLGDQNKTYQGTDYLKYALCLVSHAKLQQTLVALLLAEYSLNILTKLPVASFFQQFFNGFLRKLSRIL